MTSVAATSSTVSFADDFERADNNTAIGGSWVGDTTSFGIASGKAYPLASSFHTVRIDAGSTEHEISVDVAAAISGGQSIVVRYADTANYIFLTYIPGSATWNINRVVGGGVTFVGNIGTPFGDTGRIHLRAQGTLISARMTGGPWQYYTVTNAALQTGTVCGLRWGNGTAGASRTFDNARIIGGKLPVDVPVILAALGSTVGPVQVAASPLDVPVLPQSMGVTVGAVTVAAAPLEVPVLPQSAGVVVGPVTAPVPGPLEIAVAVEPAGFVLGGVQVAASPLDVPVIPQSMGATVGPVQVAASPLEVGVVLQPPAPFQRFIMRAGATASTLTAADARDELGAADATSDPASIGHDDHVATGEHTSELRSTP